MRDLPAQNLALHNGDMYKIILPWVTYRLWNFRLVEWYKSSHLLPKSHGPCHVQCTDSTVTNFETLQCILRNSEKKRSQINFNKVPIPRKQQQSIHSSELSFTWPAICTNLFQHWSCSTACYRLPGLSFQTFLYHISPCRSSLLPHVCLCVSLKIAWCKFFVNVN